ncbi:hypothetical protein LTR09_003485 [Extremus antarcticus]|uniref:UBC core domain-containing protein n=1 Tax=Extremus antarcticus TaxID=702011 RepID=A0AAJ0GBC2_9PEZI|nr:hypothetical protein LTR09_003485 [Extremus antarcticus]
MDSDSLRHKRLKRFDPLSSPDEEPVASPVMPDTMCEDERFARDLQAQIEREERPLKKPDTPMYTDMNGNNPWSQYAANQQMVPTYFDGTGALPATDVGKLPPNNFFSSSPGYFQHSFHHSSFPGANPPVHLGGTPVTGALYAERRKRTPTPAPKPETPPPTYLTAHDIDPSDDAAAVRILDRDNAVHHFDQLLDEGPTGSRCLLLLCGTCGAKTCLGCGATLTTETLEFGATTEKGIHFTWHCDRGRLTMLWLMLCCYDNRARHNKVIAVTPRKHPAQSRSKQPKYGGFQPHHHSRKHNGVAAAKGVGYAADDEYEDDGTDALDDLVNAASVASAAFAGTGFSVDGKVTSPVNLHQYHPRVRGRAPIAPVVDPDDALTALVMPALCALLPSSTTLVPTVFDHDPPRILACMLSRSSLLDKAAELLRNDSLEDATARIGCYEALLDLIRVFASGSRLTAEILHTERTINKAGHDLMKLSYALPTRLQNEQQATAASIMQSMANLTSQSNMMLRNAQANAEVFESEEGQQLIRLCTNVLDCNDMLTKSTPRRSAKGKAKEAETADKDAWQKPLALLEVPDEDILACHYSAKAAKDMKTPKTGRMRHVIKEITNLQTSLPPGIFVRHGESRLDVMKVLIVGPKGTPYENGLFEFDLFCPPNYPNEPPQMHIKTTGGGKHRFNPNLYADGKVCLSVLNTWQGAQWTPGQSTILQVLVSIQAMIFCDEPHCNEPGFEQEGGSDQSKHYNRGQYAAVIKYAMLEWLEGNRTVTPASNRMYHPPMPVDEDDYGDGEDDIDPMVYGSVDPADYPHVVENYMTKSKDNGTNPKTGGEIPGGYSTDPTHLGMSTMVPKTPMEYGNLEAAPNSFVSMPHDLLSTPYVPFSAGQSVQWQPNGHNTDGQTYGTTPTADSEPSGITNLDKLMALKDHMTGPKSGSKKQPSKPPKYHARPTRPEAPVDKSDMWAAVVQKHFETKHDEILETVCRWIDDKGSGTTGRGKGRRLGSASETSVAPAKTKTSQAEHLKAKGNDLPEQLRAALKELPEERRYGYAVFNGHHDGEDDD